jgi:hypothetical protein
LVVLFAIGSGEHYQFSMPLTFNGGTRSPSHASGAFSLLYDSTLPSPGSGLCTPTCTVRDRGTLTGTISRPA